MVIGGEGSIYAGANGAFAEFCVICSAYSISIGVIEELEVSCLRP